MLVSRYCLLQDGQPDIQTGESGEQPCIAAHLMDFWKTWGRIFAAGVVPRADPRHSAAQRSTTTPPPRRRRPTDLLPRDSVCLVLSSTIPSFQSVPLGFFLQDATKSATSLNHHNRLNSPDYTTYLSVYKISCTETYCRASDLMSRTRTALPASPRLPSSKSNTDWPDRIGLASSFIRGITFPAIFPSTRHHPLHCGTAYTLG